MKSRKLFLDISIIICYKATMTSAFKLPSQRIYTDSATARAVNIDLPFQDTELAVGHSLLLELTRIFNLSAQDSSGFILFGGALRDTYLDHIDGTDYGIKDFDIAVSLQDLKNGNHKITNLEDAEDIFELLEQQGIIQNLSFGKLSKAQTSVQFLYEGREVDLKIVDEPVSLEKMALYGDSVLGAIAMDAQGRIMAHHRFEDDAEERKYRCRVADKKEQMKCFWRYDAFKNRNNRGSFQFIP